MNNTPYNRIAGQSVERLTALSDGIFAVAMTLLVLDLRVSVSTEQPALNALFHIAVWDDTLERTVLGALGALSPKLLTYLMSFLTLGIFWVGQQTQLNHFARSDRNLTWIHLTYLLAVSLIPFSTALLSSNIGSRVALVVYWLNILMLGVVLLVSLRYAWRVGLIKDEIPTEMFSTNQRRIFVAQALYAFGAALCVINTYWSIAFIVLAQLNYATAPRIPFLNRL